MQLRHIAAAVLAAAAAIAVPQQADAATFTAYEFIGDGVIPEVFSGAPDLWRLRGDSSGVAAELNAATVAAQNGVSASFGQWNTSDVSYTHDLNWVTPQWDTFTSATLFVFAFGPDGGNDAVIVDAIDLGDLVGDGLLIGEWFTLSAFNGTSNVLAQLNADGKLNVTIDKQGRLDPLSVVGSKLYVEYEAVPEPATMLLLGAGLIGAAVGVRRRA